MPRTKEQLAQAIADKKIDQFMASATWDDLIASMQAQNAGQKQKLMSMIMNGNVKQVGETLRTFLNVSAAIKAKEYADGILADDTIDLDELDELV